MKMSVTWFYLSDSANFRPMPCGIQVACAEAQQAQEGTPRRGGFGNSAKATPRLSHRSTLPDPPAASPPTHLIVSTSGTGTAVRGELAVAALVPRLGHPRGPARARCHLEFKGGVGCVILEGRLWLCAWRQLFGDSGDGVRVRPSSGGLGLVREGEKVLRGYFLITVVLFLRDLLRHLQGSALGSGLDGRG